MQLFRLALMLLPLAGCAGGPQALGITGPNGSTTRAATAPAAPAADPLDNQNLMHSGTRYGPTYAPRTGSSGFWGYN